jgi:hypothetical protein
MGRHRQNACKEGLLRHARLGRAREIAARHAPFTLRAACRLSIGLDSAAIAEIRGLEN